MCKIQGGLADKVQLYKKNEMKAFQLIRNKVQEIGQFLSKIISVKTYFVSSKLFWHIEVSSF